MSRWGQHGQPGACAYDRQDRLVGVLALGIADDRVQTVHSIVNPDKLRHLDERLSDLGPRVQAARRPGHRG